MLVTLIPIIVTIIAMLVAIIPMLVTNFEGGLKDLGRSFLILKEIIPIQAYSTSTKGHNSKDNQYW